MGDLFRQKKPSGSCHDPLRLNLHPPQLKEDELISLTACRSRWTDGFVDFRRATDRNPDRSHWDPITSRLGACCLEGRQDRANDGGARAAHQLVTASLP